MQHLWQISAKTNISAPIICRSVDYTNHFPISNMCYVYTHIVATKKDNSAIYDLKVSTLHGSRVAGTELAKTTSCRVVVLRRPLGHWRRRGRQLVLLQAEASPKGAEVGLRLNLRLLGNIGDQSSSGLMGRPTFLVGAPTIDDQTAATCKPLCTRLWAWPENKRSVVCKVKAALLGVIKRGELWSFDCSLVNWLINKF